MSLNKTRYGRKHVLDHFLGRIAHAFPTNMYLGLFTASPTDLGTLSSEVAVGAYARQEISDLLGDATLATGIISNASAITFPTATADYPEVTYLGILDALTAGNMIYWGSAVTSRIIPTGDAFLIGIGQLTIQEQ